VQETDWSIETGYARYTQIHAKVRFIMKVRRLAYKAYRQPYGY